MPVFMRKQSARLAATLNSPPLTWIWHWVALRNGNDAGVQAMDQRAERDQVQRAVFANFERLAHLFPISGLSRAAFGHVKRLPSI